MILITNIIATNALRNSNAVISNARIITETTDIIADIYLTTTALIKTEAS